MKSSKKLMVFEMQIDWAREHPNGVYRWQAFLMRQLR